MMCIGWHDLAAGVDAAVVDIDGFAATALTASHFLLLPEPACCAGCVPRNPLAAVEVFAASPVPLRGQALRLSGTWRLARDDTSDWRYQLHDARLREPPGWGTMTRRGLLAAGPLMCLAATATAQPGPEEARRVVEAVTTVDIHSHAGGIANPTRIRSAQGFGAVAAPMRQAGMAAICLAIVPDGPTHRVAPDGRIRPYRDPAPGELYEYSKLAFGRTHATAREQGLAVITDTAGLRAARSGTPSAIIAAEGADFLEGRLERIDEAHAAWALRHLQLTHYRVNELGDIQTEAPVHFGLTDFSADVIRRCNRLGLVVDVAHGTYDLVKRAASVTTKPLVLSHTSLRSDPRPYSRLITPDHARVIASTGGVIGVWPPAGLFGSLTALATGMARMVDVVGIDHVSVGSDMRGLVGASIFPDYDQLPALAEALLGVGFSAGDTGKILGGITYGYLQRAFNNSDLSVTYRDSLLYRPINSQRLGEQLLLAASDIKHRRQQGGNGRHPNADGDRTGDLRCLVAKQIGAETIERRPRGAARDIGDHEAAKRHAVGARQERRHRAQQHDEARGDDYLHPVTDEKRAAEGQPSLGQADRATIAQQQEEAGPPPDPVADRLARDRSQRPRQNDEPDIQLMRRAGQNSGGDQQDFAGQGQTNAFQRDDNADHHIAIGVQKFDEMMQREERHGRHKATGRACNKVAPRWLSDSMWW